jgi:hypothetical protein
VDRLTSAEMAVMARGLPRCCRAAIADRAADPGTLSPSLPAYAGHPAYGLDALRCDLDRFAFLLGGNDGEHLLEPERD